MIFKVFLALSVGAAVGYGLSFVSSHIGST